MAWWIFASLRETTGGSTDQNKPYVSISVVTVQTSRINWVPNSPKQESIAQSDAICQRPTKEAEEAHEAKHQSIRCVDKVG